MLKIERQTLEIAADTTEFAPTKVNGLMLREYFEDIECDYLHKDVMLHFNLKGSWPTVIVTKSEIVAMLDRCYHNLAIPYEEIEVWIETNDSDYLFLTLF